MLPSPEFAALLRVARLELGADMAALEAEDIAWDALPALATRLRVLPLVARHANALAKVMSPQALTALHQARLAAAARAVLLTRELGHVLEALRDADVEALAYKGPALAIQAYGQCTLRTYDDLDVIVRPADRARAREALAGLGYRRKDDVPEEILLRSECDELLVDPGRGVFLELHWAVVPPTLSLQIDVEGLFRRRTTIGTGELEAFAPGREDLVLLLCVNGTKDAWRRLDPVCAIAELVAAGVDGKELLSTASEAHAVRLLGVGLVLAERLRGVAPPAPIADAIARDPAVTALADAAIERLASGRKPGRAEKLAFICRSRERRRDRLRTWIGLAVTPNRTDVEALRLPSRLWPGYFAVHAVRLIGKRLRPLATSKAGVTEGA